MPIRAAIAPRLRIPEAPRGVPEIPVVFKVDETHGDISSP